MTRILYITARADIGGGQECLYRLARQAQGNAECFIACPLEEPYWTRFRDLVGEARLFEIPHRRLSLTSICKLRSFVRENAIELIHSHGFGAGLYGRPVAILSGVPAVHTFHGLVFNPKKSLHTLPRLGAEWILSVFSKRLIAVSKSEENHLKRWLFPYSRKIQRIHNGISSGESASRPPAPTDKLTRILWVGRMHEQKDPLQVVDIAAQLGHLLPPGSFTIEMVGDGALIDDLRTEVVHRGLENVILLRGATNNPRPYYEACDILLSTSRWEGLPTCVLEAMEAGLLVVASGVTGNVDIVEHYGTGLIFNKNSPQQAADLLSSVVRGEMASTDMRKAAKKRVVSEFGMERFANEHLSLYRSISQKRVTTLVEETAAQIERMPQSAGHNSTLRVAVVHEWLTSYAGSEKVVEQILSVFPTADLFCLVDFLPQEERKCLGKTSVKTSFLQKLPFGATLFRKLLWLLPIAVESFDLTPYDIVISSSHAVAKGVLTGPDQLHICYCHSPIRYAWDLQHEYLRQAGFTRGLSAIYARLTLHYMRLWDIRTSNGVDRFIANSRFIARRIQKIYRRDAAVIHPPIDLEGFQLQTNKENYYITVSRLVPYKRVDLIVAAFSRMPDHKLIVIGDGPNLESWKREATSNVQFLGRQPDQVVREMMGRAKAFLFAAEEDFGITVVEAQACGTPVICYGRGGVLDSVVAGKTGLFFNHQNPESIQRAVETFETIRESFDPRQIRSHAETFSTERFRREFQTLVLDEAKKRDMFRDVEPTSTHVNDLAALETVLAGRELSREQTVESATLQELLPND
jgi:O-antigen biosynthesis alpha-1,3-mannosyltransferase